MNPVAGFFIVLMVALGGTFIWFIVEDAAKQEAFLNVCEYESGDVEGDVCIKDGRVILTRKEYEEAND